jgi:hypothetical protein
LNLHNFFKHSVATNPVCPHSFSFHVLRPGNICISAVKELEKEPPAGDVRDTREQLVPPAGKHGKEEENKRGETTGNKFVRNGEGTWLRQNTENEFEVTGGWIC